MPGTHTYVSRVAEGNTAQVAKRLPDTLLNPEGPVAF
jgi:hypothetical protein